jgi:lactate dehydrogenase-like 2-hydroxyacid dehydrogenase
MSTSIKAIIDVFWHETHQAFEGYVDFKIGHVCDCHHCGRTGLTMHGVVSSGHTEKQAFQIACKNIQAFLSMVQGVPMSIITQPGTTEVEFCEDVVAAGAYDEEEYDTP